jgi:hypothetical protein
VTGTEGAGVPAPALVLGFAACLPADVAEAEKLFPGAIRFGVNRAALKYRCDHLVSIDRNKIPLWLPDYPITVHSGRIGAACGEHPPSKYPWVHHWWPQHHTKGSSAWLAAKIAHFEYGFAPVVLCGCPIDSSPHLEEDTTCARPWDNPYQVESCRETMMAEVEMKPFVRSMSGWTREWFGGPDEWA